MAVYHGVNGVLYMGGPDEPAEEDPEDFWRHSFVVICRRCRTHNRIGDGYGSYTCYKCAAEYWVEHHDLSNAYLSVRQINGKSTAVIIEGPY